MGENFLKQQIDNFEKSTDAAMNVLERRDLIRRPEISNTMYKACPSAGESFVEGETLFAVAVEDGASIELSRGHLRVGVIAGQGAEVLGERMRGLGSILSVRVVSVSEISLWGSLEVIEA